MQRSSGRISREEARRFRNALHIFPTNEKCMEYNIKRMLELKSPVATIEVATNYFLIPLMPQSCLGRLNKLLQLIPSRK